MQGKPHDFGMIGYADVQQLQHKRLPIALAISINHITRSLTPTDCVLELHRTLVAANPDGPTVRQLVVDSLWSNAASIKQFDLYGIKYCVSLKSDSKIIPATLFTVSSSDLPVHMTRTYTDGTQTLEVINAGNHTLRILTNM